MLRKYLSLVLLFLAAFGGLKANSTPAFSLGFKQTQTNVVSAAFFTSNTAETPKVFLNSKGENYGKKLVADLVETEEEEKCKKLPKSSTSFLALASRNVDSQFSKASSCKRQTYSQFFYPHVVDCCLVFQVFRI